MIPVDVADVTSEWMSGALDREVRAVTVLDRHSGTTGRARVGVEYANGSSGPETAFVKLAPFDPQQRAFVDQVGLGLSEARFYREIAAELPVRVPQAYHSDWDDDGRTVIELAEVDEGTLVHVVETAPGFATALELSALAWTPVA